MTDVAGLPRVSGGAVSGRAVSDGGVSGGAVSDGGVVGRGRRAEGTRRRAPMVGDEAVVVSATGIVSLVNYAYTLILLWLLPTEQFAEVGSISALLLICGTVAGAALPWVLAQEVLRSRTDFARRRAAVTFCLGATVLQGIAAGLAACLIASRYAPGGVVAVVFASVFLIFLAATVAGYFQGKESFRLIAALRVAEVGVKVGAGLGLVALGAGAGGAIAGFALGAGVVAGVGLVFMLPYMTWSWSAFAGRHLWVSTRGLLAIQAGVAVLASMDVVIGSLILGIQPALATYQAANILGRVPVFLGAALSIVIFPKMIAGRSHPHVLIRESIGLYVMLCVPVTMVTATLPAPITSALFPARYGDVASVLPWAALGGLVMGAVNLGTTYFQATGRYRRTSILLAVGVVIGVALDVTGLHYHGIIGLAMAVALGGAVVTAALCREIFRTWPGALHGTWRPLLLAGIVCLPLWPLRGHPVAWTVWAVFCGVVFCLRSLAAATTTGDGPAGLARPRVLHLGYEDPRRPGAGGGSVRTHEINSRLSGQFDITVVCARYRGSRTRVEDGVRYVHIGVPAGDFPEKIAYFASIPYALLRHRSDLVVEDFGAPVSSVAVPWLTSRPVVGVVQWLFADEKSRQYHLPFSWVERLGVRSHRRMIAVSADLGLTLSERNPAAEVSVIANGLDDGAFSTDVVPRSGIAYLGRLEIAQKGLDLLLESFARVAGAIDQDLVLGGDGPDREALERQAADLGIDHRVHFIGRVAASERFTWLAGMDLVAMPSRYETFGMVAAEALAVGTPVVAFDIPCLRALVDDQVGRRVPAFDVVAFADAMAELASDAELRARTASTGPERVAELNWDDLAVLQAQVYRELIQGHSGAPIHGKPDWTAPLSPTVAGAAVPADRASPSIVDRIPDGSSNRSPNGSPVEKLRGSSDGSLNGSPLFAFDLFVAQLGRTPDAVAVVDDHTNWTFADLARAASIVTRQVLAAGHGQGTVVGVHLARSPEAIAAMLGIWAAGATYVPLDPAYPAERIREMVRAAGTSMVVGRHQDLDSLGIAVATVDAGQIDPRGPDPIARSGTGPDAPTSDGRATSGTGRRGVGAEDRAASPPDPAAVAYILFTSGSSGRPKGVRVSQGNLANFVDWMLATLSADELSVCATSISFSFDPFLIEVLGPLLTGGTVRVIPSALALADIETGATLLVNTPSVVSELLHAGRFPSTVQTVVVGGERLTASLAEELLTTTHVTRLINSYGPTEATVLATAHEVSLPVVDPVPVGTELSGAQVVIVDENLDEVSTGVPGEICIYGPQVALGYADDAGATERQFPLRTDLDGGRTRIYRTGDVGSKDAAGVVTFLGRRDRQLKFRGYRIEPEEIEAVLEQQSGVDRAAVLSTGVGVSGRLVAFVTTRDDEVTPEQLRLSLRTLLPDYMVPATVAVVPVLPSTANGKVDLDLLRSTWMADPVPEPGIGPQDDPEANGDDVAAAIAGLARRILQFEGPISEDDDFLDDLGGSSLALFQLLAEMELAFGRPLAIERILEDTTIAGLARLAHADDASPVHLSVHPGGTKCPVFLVHAYLGTALRYRYLGTLLSADRPVTGIQVQEFGSGDRPELGSIEQMASEMVAQIRLLRPCGPYLLGGHSAGGLVAFEAARMLRAEGEEVPLVVLIDCPLRSSAAQYLWAEVVLNWPDLRAESWSGRVEYVRSAVRRRRPTDGTDVNGDRVSAAVARSYLASNLAVRMYRPGPYDGDVAVLATRQGVVMGLGAEDLGWGRVVTGKLTVAAVPGLHNTLFESPYVEVVASTLDELLERTACTGSDALAMPAG